MQDQQDMSREEMDSTEDTLAMNSASANDVCTDEGDVSSLVSTQEISEAEIPPTFLSSPQQQTPDSSRPQSPLLHPHLDMAGSDTLLFSSSVDMHPTDLHVVSIQELSDVETPFVSVPPLPESPSETFLFSPKPLLLGHPAAPTGLDFSENGIQSCLSSMRSLASGLSTPLASKKFKTSDSDAGTDLLPVCRICQLPGDKEDFLFSPCRCSGTMMFVHYLCLLKWIEISTRKTRKTPRCELCHFQYIRHKRFKFGHWRLPRVSSRDKCMHIVFFVNLLIMVGCAVATILCFLSDRGHLQELPRRTVGKSGNSEVALTTEEIITLTCGILFFVSFFIAMTVQIKARHTVYKLFLRFLAHNTEWKIEPYQRVKDLQLTEDGPAKVLERN